MRRVVNVSGGAASAVALLRVIERYGTGDVTACFADTLTEDPDLYRFLDDLERVAGIPITRLSNGQSIWDVFQSEMWFTNPHTGGCVASYFLKKLALRKHLDDVGANPIDTIIYVGFDPSEDDRQQRLIKAGAPWSFDFPLCWKPRLLRCDQEDYLASRGLVPCSMYDRGYGHANCGGTCVLAGIQQWAMVLSDYPERFAKAEQVERDIMATMAAQGKQPHSILRSRRGGTSTTLTLEQLRLQVSSGERSNGDEYRASACNCVGDLF